jgi:small GTP-binding protein
MWFLKNRRKKAIKGNITIIGPSKAGKTTLARYLETNEPVEEDTISTMGITMRKKPVKIGDWTFGIIDIGGQDIYQQTFWQLGIKQAIAVIYIIDGTIKPNPENKQQNMLFESSVEAFNYMVNFVYLGEIPILILINKQDLVDQQPLTLEEAKQLYELNRVLENPYSAAFPVSAKFGDKVEDATNWLGYTLMELFDNLK